MTTLLLSLGVSLAATGLFIPVLRKAEFWDVPNQRSSHVVPTPRGGGLAVMLALILAVALSSVGGTVWPLLLIVGSLALIGLIDDLRSLPSSVRLIGQILGAVAVVAWVVRTEGHAGPEVLFGIVSMLGVVAFVNAFNFMDGVNGISGFNAAVSGGWFAWLGHVYDVPMLTVVGLALLGAAVGYLPWNLAGRVFLGDVGSYGLGALIAGLAVLAWATGVPGPLAIASLLVYLADTGWTLIKRKRRGARLSEAHREHIYQQLVSPLGWSHVQSAAWNAGLGASACAVMYWLGASVSFVVGVLATGLVVFLYLASPELVSRGQK